MMDRKKVIVIGANGTIARQIIPLLIKNYEVYCLTRSPASFAINSIFLRFIQGDALSPEVWDQCLEGKDAVISCFGAREGQSQNGQLQLVNLLTHKMPEKGVKRFIGFFSHGAMVNSNGQHIYESQGFSNKQRGLVHSQSIQALQASELDFTAVCLWKFALGGGQVETLQNSWTQTAACSQGVAAFLHSELQNPHFSRKTIFLRNKH